MALERCVRSRCCIAAGRIRLDVAAWGSRDKTGVVDTHHLVSKS
jgi:hypothetical protein